MTGSNADWACLRHIAIHQKNVKFTVMHQTLSALVYRGSSGLFIAICLEHDIAAQASTVDAAIEALERSYTEHLRIGERRGERPFRSQAAPVEYWSRFEVAKPLSDASSTFASVRVVADR